MWFTLAESSRSAINTQPTPLGVTTASFTGVLDSKTAGNIPHVQLKDKVEHANAESAHLQRTSDCSH